MTFAEDIPGAGMTFNTNAVGDTVRIQLVGTNRLQLAEVYAARRRCARAAI